jgi:hypothetical protein
MGDPIRVGHIDLSFHDGTAREAERVLVAHGLAEPPALERMERLIQGINPGAGCRGVDDDGDVGTGGP